MMRAFPFQCGPVAQLGARFHGMEEVVGSIPTRSTNYCEVFRSASFSWLCHILITSSKISPSDRFASGRIVSGEITSSSNIAVPTAGKHVATGHRKTYFFEEESASAIRVRRQSRAAEDRPGEQT
jgi:hypothetical protein